MSDENTTRTIEGFAEELTPATFKAAEEMYERSEAWNREGGDLQVMINNLMENNKSLLRAIAHLEMQVRTLKGEIITSGEG